MRSAMTIGLIVLLSGCSNTMWTNKPTVPETSRTAVVHDIRVSLTDIAPPELRVNVGDEVRFINDKTQPVRVILIEAGKSIACNKGFNGTIDQEADIKPGQYASFCFNKTGTIKYMAREQTAVTGGEQVLSAQIHIGGSGSAAQPTRARESHPSSGRSEAETDLRFPPER
jgi:plastocyanin